MSPPTDLRWMFGTTRVQTHPHHTRGDEDAGGKRRHRNHGERELRCPGGRERHKTVPPGVSDGHNNWTFHLILILLWETGVLLTLPSWPLTQDYFVSYLHTASSQWERWKQMRRSLISVLKTPFLDWTRTLNHESYLWCPHMDEYPTLPIIPDDIFSERAEHVNPQLRWRIRKLVLTA